MSSEIDLFAFLNDVSHEKKGDLLTDATQKVYNPYMINRFLACNIDSVLEAQELNQRPWLDKSTQYDYLSANLRKRRRKFKFAKTVKNDKLEFVMKIFNYSHARAMEAMAILTDEQILQLEQSVDRGGVENSGNARKKKR